MEKACTKCGEVKALSEFSKGRNQCKVCLAAYQKAHYQANKEKKAAYQKAHYQANKEKLAAMNKAHYQANREKIAAYQKAYNKANKEKVTARSKAYREANREKLAAMHKAYLEANREACYLRMRKYRAIKRQAYVPRCDYWKQIEVEMGEKRRELQEQTGNSYHIDHIYPLSKGGIDHPVNYQILPAEENISKRDKVDSDCPQQAKLGLISRLVLEEGVDVNEAIKLANAR